MSSLYEKIEKGEEKISLVGLGYVGMPIAVAFARKVKVVGFDLNQAKIDLYKNGRVIWRRGKDGSIKVVADTLLRNDILFTRYAFCMLLFIKETCQKGLER